MTASGAVTLSFGGVGNFSAGGVVNAGVSTIDLSNQVSVGTTTLVSYSATSLSMTLGAGSGTVSAGLISLNDAGALTNNFVLDGLNYEGQLNIEQLSASGAITMSMGGANGISASIINSGGNLTLEIQQALQVESFSRM